MSEAQEKLDRVRVRERRLLEDRDNKLRDALARENELEARLRAAEGERDAWRVRGQAAEERAAEDRDRAKAAEEGKAYAESQELIAKDMADFAAGRLDLEEHKSAELLREKAAALERIGAVELAAAEAERSMERSALERDQARSRERTALDRVEEMTREVEQLKNWAQEAEAQARDRARIAESRARDAVAAFRESPEFAQEVTEGSLDAYTQGFAECKARVARAFQIDSAELDEIQPGDADE